MLFSRQGAQHIQIMRWYGREAVGVEYMHVENNVKRSVMEKEQFIWSTEKLVRSKTWLDNFVLVQLC